MASIKFSDSRLVSDYSEPYIVAEMNTSHFGDLSQAKLMIDQAISAGVDCVKFQSWTEDTLYSDSYYVENPIAKRFIKKFSFAESDLLELATYSNSKGVSFASTPYSDAEVDFLVEKCNVPFLKIASMELNNIPFLEYIGSKMIPVVLSTGMGEDFEIKNAVNAIMKSGNSQIIVLHCVSIYPTPAELMNLRNIEGLRELLPGLPIGFSDHSEGIYMSIAATALGAALIEKHFTLDRHKQGADHGYALEPREFETYVRNIRNAVKWCVAPA